MNWFETRLKVRYQETDKMGVVYHANYFVWFEVGRTETVKELGISYKEMENQGLLLPVVNVSCDYKISATYDDEVIIRTKIAEYNGFRMEFQYQVVRAEDMKLLATGTTKHVWINKDYRPTRIDKAKPDIYKKLENYLNQTS